MTSKQLPSRDRNQSSRLWNIPHIERLLTNELTGELIRNGTGRILSYTKGFKILLAWLINDPVPIVIVKISNRTIDV